MPDDPQTSDLAHDPLVEDATRHLLASLVGVEGDSYPQMTRDSQSRPQLGIDWNLLEATEETELAQSADQQAVAMISQGLLERLDQLSVLDNFSEDEVDERSEDEDDPPEPVVGGMLSYFQCFYFLILLYR